MTVRLGAGSESHVAVTTATTATVGDLATALAHSDRLRGMWPAGRELTLRLLADGVAGGRTLPGGRTLVESGIQSGSTVEIAYAEDAPSGSDRGSAAAVLRVLSGPDAGQEFPLPVGSSFVGRAASSDVRLSDPMISKTHARINVGPRIEIIDSGSANGVVVGGVRVGRTVVAHGDVAELGDTRLTVLRVAGAAAATGSPEVEFVRPPRVLARPSDAPIDLPELPRPPQASRFPWLALVAPLAMGAGLFIATGQMYTLLFIALSPLLMIGNYVDQRVQRKRAFAQEVATFESALAVADDELARGHELDRTRMLALHPALPECVEAVRRTGGVLWSRRPEHPEFLQVRLGLGAIEPYHRPVAPRPTGLAEFFDRAVAVADAHALLLDAPVVADVRSVGGLGICGDPSYVAGVARGVVLQIAALHSPAEVTLACLTTTTGRERWSWLEWLPHTSSPHSPIPSHHLSADPGSGKVLLSQLEELVEVRARDGVPAPRGPLARGEESDRPTVPSVVVVVDDATVDLARLIRVAERGPDVGVYLLWVAPAVTALPAACRTYLDVAGGTGSVGMVRRGRTIESVALETLDVHTALALARQLAPVVDAGTPVQDQSDLPRSVSMVSLVGHEASDDASVVLARWRENKSLVPRDGSPPVPRDKEGDLSAVVGRAGNEDFSIDLRSQGPHALVGGTTGAGKSEFLQAWVLGLAHAYSPDRVTFLFVDYKGGAAFAKCRELPHCVGMVTDLTPYLVRRALVSLRAELHRRERLLNAKGAKDLAELERTGDPECPPSLIIVVDEFAALVGEVPAFVDGMVDIAQRGRSLGLHLVLATQRPAGVIKENLRANTNLRIALRMAEESDSLDVLGDQMAAHFPASIPGRGAAKTGPGRISQFQSAYPGARTPLEPERPPIDVVDLDFGRSQPWQLPTQPKVGDRIRPDIDRLVDAVSGAASLGGVPTPRKPWLDTLATTYNLARFSLRRDTRIPLGVLDDPEQQAQEPEHYLPDEEGHILYVGASGSGKSTALRSLAVASAVTPGGGVVHVYGLDFSGGQLTSLQALPNVGSIVSGDDEERVRRLIGHLAEVVEERSERYSRVPASTLQEYRAATAQPDESRLLLLLDGFSTFRSSFESSIAHQQMYQQFQRLLLDGRAVGVHVAMTADRPSAVPSSILSAFRRRIVLRLADEDAYVAMGVPRDVLHPGSPPGRAIQPDKVQELQLAILLSEEHSRTNTTSSAAQVAAVELLATEIERYHRRPEPIRSLPVVVPSPDVPAAVGGRPVLGVSDTTLEPMGFDPTGLVLVAGPAQSGRTNAVRWLAEAVHRCHPETPLVHLSARRTPLSTLSLWSDTADNEADVVTLLAGLAQVAAQPSPVGMPLVAVFVEFLPEFIGTSAEQALIALLGACRRNGHLVVAEGETSSWGAPWPLAMEVRNARTGLLLQPDQGDGDSLLRTSLPRVKRADLPPGRGFWVRGGRAEKVQLPLVEEWVDRPIDAAPVLPDSSAAPAHQNGVEGP